MTAVEGVLVAAAAAVGFPEPAEAVSVAAAGAAVAALSVLAPVSAELHPDGYQQQRQQQHL